MRPRRVRLGCNWAMRSAAISLAPFNEAEARAPRMRLDDVQIAGDDDDLQ